jgi:PPK2 family polyphosphate:nucleotide phosphotransferase
LAPVTDTVQDREVAKKKRTAPDDLGAMLRVPPDGSAVDLSTYDPGATPGCPGDEKRALAAMTAMGVRLAVLQEKLYARGTVGDPRRMLLVLQGMDTSGKGGTVKHVIGQLNPAGCRYKAFTTPTEEERRHHFLWRIRKALPKPGEVGVFDRSHYEEVLIVRVHGLVPREVWASRYDEINAFEQSLADDGFTVVKVFLHISYEEQRARLLARLDNPRKHWKFRPSDIEERALWPAYQEAYQDALAKCSTAAAPWYVVPADHKWYRNWAVSKLLLEHFRALDLHYPPAAFDVEEARRRLQDT